MRIAIRRIGNSKGIAIALNMLEQVGLTAYAHIIVEDGPQLVLPAESSVREGWAPANQKLAKYGDDALLLPEFGNAGDEDLQW